MVPPAVPSREPAPAPPRRSPRPRPSADRHPLTWRAAVLQPAPRGLKGQHHHPSLSTLHPTPPPSCPPEHFPDRHRYPLFHPHPTPRNHVKPHPRDSPRDPHHPRSKPSRPAPTRPLALFTSHASRPAVRAAAREAACAPASRPPARRWGAWAFRAAVGLVSSGPRGCGRRGATSPCAFWSGLAGACHSAGGYLGREVSLHRWGIGSGCAPASRRRWQLHAYATRRLPTPWLSPTAARDSTLRRQHRHPTGRRGVRRPPVALPSLPVTDSLPFPRLQPAQSALAHLTLPPKTSPPSSNRPNRAPRGNSHIPCQRRRPSSRTPRIPTPAA